MRIILQARTSSTRLPAKVLLPLGGIPLAILCAKRLGNRGTPVVLATSGDPTDDELAAQTQDNGIQVFRGSLDDVARRFLDCSADMVDEDIIVRATADNPVPDGTLVAQVVADFRAAGLPYFGPDQYQAVPHGLGVEVFRLGAFRRCFDEPVSAAMAEHVTTKLRLAPPHANQFFSKRFALGGDLCLTIDTLEDYLVMARAFRTVGNAVAADWQSLVEAARTMRGAHA